MKTIIDELQHIISIYPERFEALPSKELSDKPNPDKWSKKEVLGHLIDSAHNNLRRFIVGQYEDIPHIVYDQDFWVKVNRYQEMKSDELISLWSLLNKRIVEVLQDMPSDNHSRECNTGKEEKVLHNLQWLAADYVKHMKHHINQIIPSSFDITYP